MVQVEPPLCSHLITTYCFVQIGERRIIKESPVDSTNPKVTEMLGNEQLKQLLDKKMVQSDSFVDIKGQRYQKLTDIPCKEIGNETLEDSNVYHRTGKFTKYTHKNRNRKEDLKNVTGMSTDKEISTSIKFSNVTDRSLSQNINTQSLTNRSKVLQDLTTARLPMPQLDKSLPTLSKDNDSSKVLRETSIPKRQAEEKYINEETKFHHPLTKRTKCMTGKQEQTMSLKQSSRRKLVFLFLILCVSNIKAQDCSVFWDISTTVNIGQDVTLKCMFQGDDSNQCIGYPRWEGGPQRQIISLDKKLFPEDSEKYSIKISPGEYDLVIRNITEEDLNCSYTCHKRFAYYKAVLREKLTTVELTTINILKETVPKKSAVHIPSTKSPQMYADTIDNTNNVNKRGETNQTNPNTAIYSCLAAIILFIPVGVAFVVYKRYIKKRGESQKSEYRSRTYRYTPTENKVEA